ncbi:MAG: endonuclease MutS2, partial [Tannerellaceae bacterium]|nr:endonuclease MutS2 [Tannerellaceae bacterium]
MIYPQNFEQKTGFDRIRELVAANCLGSLGRERVAAMHFSTDYARITEALERTSEMMRILAGEREFPSDFFFDLRPSLRRIRPEGTHLGEKEAFDLWRSLGTLRDIVHFFHPPKGEGSPYPCLSALAGEVPLFPGILSALASLLDASGRVKDTASADLVRIRGEIAHTEGSLSRILGSILRAAQEEGFVERDLSPTLRDGRLVIPVAPAFRRRIRGIVHDESASGKT